MIRTANPSDLGRVCLMGLEFSREACLSPPADLDVITSYARTQIVAGDRLALILELDGDARGLLMAAVARSPFAPFGIAIEQAFWIDPAYRGRWALRMIDAYTEWARSMGCRTASLSSLASLSERSPDRLYARAGYSHAETVYSRDL